MAAIAKGQITITDLSDGKSISLFLGSNSPLSQIFNSDDGSYTPNWGTNNLVITPEVYVTGESDDQINRLVGTPVWKINGSENLATYGATAASTAPYALTINKNMTDVSQLGIECEVIYVDPSTTAQTKSKTLITFTKSVNSGAMTQAIIYAPDGTVFNNETTSLKAHCDLWRGSKIETEDVTYEWYSRSSGSWTEIVAGNPGGITGFTTNEITIPKDAVLNVGTFRCRITDSTAAAGDIGYREAIITFNDMSDPFQVEIVTNKGVILSSGLADTTATVNVYQGGVAMIESWYSGVTINWYKYNKDASLDTAWGTDGMKTGRSLTILRTEINVASTFTVEVIQN